MNAGTAMKKHLGWMIRLLIAALGVGYILYTLTWSDQVWLPPGYQLGEGIDGDGPIQAYVILQETNEAYQLAPPTDGQGHGPDAQWLAKSELGPGEDQPQFKPSFITILKQSDASLLIAGALLFIPFVLLSTLRWFALMRARGIEITYTRVGRLTLVGYFFNLCMPGTTGGDVMKAYYAAKGTDQRADAVVSIAIDRLCGLIGLMLLVGIIGLFSFDDPLIRKLTLAMWCVLIVLLVGAWIYTSPTFRRRLRLGAKLGKLPGTKVLRNIDAWVSAYRRHVGTLAFAIGLSLLIQLCMASSMSLAGFALGIELPLLYLLSVIPIVFVLWSLPVSGPLGLGPLDYVAVQLIISGNETTAQQALMMFVAYRLYLVGDGLIGSVALLGLGGKPRVANNDETQNFTAA